jgi:hypothetical protein
MHHPEGGDTRRSTRRIAAVVVLALLIAGWWLLRLDGGEPPAEVTIGAAPERSSHSAVPASETSDEPATTARLSAQEGERVEFPVSAAPETSKLAVRVVDAAGADVAGANVMLWPSVAAMATDTPLIAVSDAAGRCTLDAPASLAIVAEKRGVGTSRCVDWPPVRAPLTIWSSDDDPVSVSEGGALTLRLEAGTWVRGLVSDRDGQPVAAARVIAGEEPPSDLAAPVRLRPFVDMMFGTGRSLLPRITFSDEQGRFELGMGPKAAGHVFAIANGERTAGVFFVLAEDEDDKVAEVALRFAGGFAASGAVVGPVADLSKLEVWAYSHEDLVRLDGCVDHTGAFSIPLPKPGDYALFASAPGFVQDQLVSVELTEERRAARADIAMVKALSLSGTIRLSSGEPLSGAMLKLERHVTDGLSPYAWSGANPRYVRTQPDGSFGFDDVHPDEDATVGICADYRPSRFHHLRPNRSPFELVVSQPTWGAVALGVADANTGAPISDYEYSVPGNCDWRRVRNQQGRCHVHLQSPEREILIMVRAEGYSTAESAPFRVKADPTEVAMELGREGGLEIPVRDGSDHPCAGTSVTLLPAGSLSQWSKSVPVVLITDELGQASANGLVPGPHWLVCRRGDFRLGPLSVVVPSGRSEARTVVLTDDRRSGSVLARMSADPSDGTLYEFGLEPSGLLDGFVDQEPLRQRADAVIDATFPDLAPGVYALTLFGDGKEQDWCRVVVEPGSRSEIVFEPH